MSLEYDDNYTNLDINESFKLIKEHNQSIYNKKYEIQNLKDNISKLKMNIYNKCSHEWVREDVYTGPYDKPDFICKHCGLYKDRLLN